MNAENIRAITPIIGFLTGAVIALAAVVGNASGERLTALMQLSTACISGSVALAQPQKKE